MSNVPNQTLAALCGSRISAAHFPHGRCRTPLYFRLLSPVCSYWLISIAGGCDEVAAVVVKATTAVVVGVVTSSLTVAEAFHFKKK